MLRSDLPSVADASMKRRWPNSRGRSKLHGLRFGDTLVFAGDPARAVEASERNMRFDPFYSPLAPGSLGLAHYMLRQYSQALPLLRECDSWAPNLRAGHVFLA